MNCPNDLRPLDGPKQGSFSEDAMKLFSNGVFSLAFKAKTQDAVFEPLRAYSGVSPVYSLATHDLVIPFHRLLEDRES